MSLIPELRTEMEYLTEQAHVLFPANEGYLGLRFLLAREQLDPGAPSIHIFNQTVSWYNAYVTLVCWNERAQRFDVLLQTPRAASLNPRDLSQALDVGTAWCVMRELLMDRMHSMLESQSQN